MFLGTTTLTLDDEMCGGKLVISYNPMDKCLPIFPYDEWLDCMAKMDAVQDQSDQFRELQRMVFSYTTEVDMDGSGRVLVPQSSRDEIGLKKEAVLIGHGKKFELWSAESWLRTREDGDKKLVESLKSRTERIDLGFGRST